MTDFPNREHEKADNAARRRATTAIDNIVEEVLQLRKTLERGPEHRLDGDDAQALMYNCGQLVGHLGEVGALYDVREWYAADQMEEVRRLMTRPELLEAMAAALGLRTDLNLAAPARQEDLAQRVLHRMRQDAT
jgi:hypothetical protein